MQKQTGFGVAVFAQLLLVAPLSAQYKADVTVTGGPRAGFYALARAPLTCAVRKETNGTLLVTMTDTSAIGHRDRLAGFTVAFDNTAKAAEGTKVFRFGLRFGDEPAPSPALLPASDGTLTFRFVYREETFQASLTRAATGGPDDPRIEATFACKGVSRTH